MTQIAASPSLNAWLGSTREAVTDDRQPRRYQIGPVAVSVRSHLAWVREEFHHLYQSYQTPRRQRDEFCIEVYRRRSPRTLLGYYHILADGDELFAVRQPSAVLPHMEWALNSLIARYLPGYLQFHASVMSWHGAGVIFPGSPGRGKTTLAAGLLMRGWSYLSDEFALIDPQTRLLTAYPKALCIKAPAFETLRAVGVPIDQDKYHTKGFKGRVAMISPLSVRPNAVSAPCPLRLIVLPEYRPGQTPAIEPLPRARAVFELSQQCFNFEKLRGRAVELLVDLVRQARCIRLHTGDLMQSCSLIEEYMSDLES